MLNKIKYLSLFFCCIFVLSCDRSQTAEEAEHVFVEFHDQNFDITREGGIDDLFKAMELKQSLQVSKIDVASYEWQTFDTDMFLLIKAKAKTLEEEYLGITIPFLELKSKQGKAHASYNGCIMFCSSAGCDDCDHRIEYPCQSHSCPCEDNEKPGCSPGVKIMS